MFRCTVASRQGNGSLGSNSPQPDFGEKVLRMPSAGTYVPPEVNGSLAAQGSGSDGGCVNSNAAAWNRAGLHTDVPHVPTRLAADGQQHHFKQCPCPIRG